MLLMLPLGAQNSYTIWPGTAVPAVADSGPDSAVELGVKFRADASGFVTGVRFYKAAANTGTHVANLWTSSGSKLATATFAGETASGWQQVNFASPVAVTANTVYVASYHTNTGHYSDDESSFTSAGVDNPPLHALAAGVSGFNGAYAYGASSKFPNQDWKSSNYWVDVVFTTSLVSDNAPPTVTAFTIPATSSSLTVPISSFIATDNVGVTGYLVTESATPPAAGAAGWTSAAPASYTFTTAGAKTLYAWAKDAANNVSASRSASVTITLPDSQPPTVTAFTIPATSTSLTVPISSFVATDNVRVTGYIVTESATPPAAGAAGWTSAAPASYTFTTAGSKTLYAWAKDAANNVSASRSASVTITLPDSQPPTVTAFTIPATSTSLTVTISSFIATDNVRVTGYIVTESATPPAAGAAGWTSAAPASYTFTTAGAKTLYAWAKDTANNVSASRSASVTITLSDSQAPTVTAFTIPATSTSLTVTISSFMATDNIAVTGYLATESATPPAAGATGWTGAAPASYTFTTAGAKTLYAWAKDAANNVSASRSASVTITLPDSQAPTVTAFTIPATSTSLTVAISSFIATDNVGVTGYLATESATPPAAGGSGWTGATPASYTFATAGSKTLYAWAKDAANNVSASRSASVTITLPDSQPPTVTAFTIPATSTSLTVTISSFVATDNVGVTGYIVTESATSPSAGATGWTGAAPASYTFTTAGAKTLYAWAKDAANNVSAGLSASVTITLTDSQPPTVTAFTIPATSSSLTVPISSFVATDDIGVTGYLVTESATAPAAGATGWTSAAPASYTFATAGSKTLYAWAKDAANNVSAGRSASVVITISTTNPEPTGWFAGDMHVHRSCGGSPEAISTFPDKMSTNNLAVISLLADMGNGEVQNPVTDLPLVNGQDASVSSAGRIVHWDTEWHWDATYNQYPHQALGGHLVALGLTSAQQIWQEYTYPILNWAHQQGAIAGFAHLQYLDGGFPQTLTCCTPVEYPVEVALGGADFISEDVADINSGLSMNSEMATQAYYKLLNTGFRPGFAAGTDYPCNTSNPLGSLLTYVQVAGGQLTYRNWIDGIRKGRTVVSRNAHNEFLSLTVNGNATPGDEIQLAAAGSLPVLVQWTATQNLSATIELVSNGVVVASRQATVAAGAPVVWSTTVDFPKSGWVVARTMGVGGHQSHTSAVFVIVNNAPIRASAADAQYYVQWMDNLLTQTSPGGAWNHYFPTNLSQAQARYQSAKAVFQQIASESEGGSPPPSGPTIFTTQTPSMFENDSLYELGVRFWSDVSGQITQARLYTSAAEGGAHTVRIWRASDGALLAGPYTWTIAAGTEGWKSYPLPTAVAIAANTDYIVSISNSSSDQYYAEGSNGFDQPIVNGHLHTYTGSGVYAETLGVMPTSAWQNTNYFRDVVFQAN